MRQITYRALTCTLAADAYEYTFSLERLIEVRNASSASSTLLAEFRYNGLNQQIGVHYDTDSDSDVDASDVWFAYVYNEKWQQVASYRATDSSGLIGTLDGDPKQVFVWHMAGMDGRGGSSYIDRIIVEKRDSSTTWNLAANALDTDKFMMQNWRHDVVVMMAGATRRLQGARFDPHGFAFGLPRTDVNGDGGVDNADESIILLASGGSYDVRADINLDGAVNGTDQGFFTSDDTTVLGRGVFSHGPNHAQGGGHRTSFAGRERSFVGDELILMRNRALRTDLGIWSRRDPLGYVDGPNLYGYVMQPIGETDPMGLCATCGGGGGGYTTPGEVFGGTAQISQANGWGMVPTGWIMQAEEEKPTCLPPAPKDGIREPGPEPPITPGDCPWNPGDPIPDFSEDEGVPFWYWPMPPNSSRNPWWRLPCQDKCFTLYNLWYMACLTCKGKGTLFKKVAKATAINTCQIAANDAMLKCKDCCFDVENKAPEFQYTACGDWMWLRMCQSLETCRAKLDCDDMMQLPGLPNPEFFLTPPTTIQEPEDIVDPDVKPPTWNPDNDEWEFPEFEVPDDDDNEEDDDNDED